MPSTTKTIFMLSHFTSLDLKRRSFAGRRNLRSLGWSMRTTFSGVFTVLIVNKSSWLWKRRRLLAGKHNKLIGSTPSWLLFMETA